MTLLAAGSNESGRKAEDAAVEYLQAQGLRLEQRNFRRRFGELDIVMRDGSRVVFVEVRLRTNRRYGDGLSSITRAKKRRVINAARAYLACHPTLQNAPCRFDAVAVNLDGTAVQLNWVPGAFTTDDY